MVAACCRADLNWGCGFWAGKFHSRHHHVLLPVSTISAASFGRCAPALAVFANLRAREMCVGGQHSGTEA